MSYTTVDNYLWEVTRYIMTRKGVDESVRMTDPLTWYVNTGRASAGFLKRLVDTKPYIIARLLMKGGSYDEAIARVRDRIDI